MHRTSSMVLCVLLLSACKPAASHDDGGVGDVGDGGMPVVEEICTPAAGDTFCPAYASAFCAAHFACCSDPDARYDTMERCLARTTCLCTAYRQGAAPAAGTVVLDDLAAASVLAQLSGAPTGCPVAAPGALDVGAAFHGTLAEGADCSPTSADYSSVHACGPGLECYVTDFGDETTPPRADCRRLRAAGETCDDTMHCAPDLYCGDGATIDDPGVCRPHLATGAACAFDYQCASDVCDATGACAAPSADDSYCVDAATTT